MTKKEILDYFSNINDAYNDSTRFDSLSHMIDELLKEEAAEVVEEERRVLWDETDDEPVYTHDVFYHCPSCNLILSRTHKNKDINFCQNCGKAVKWE